MISQQNYFKLSKDDIKLSKDDINKIKKHKIKTKRASKKELIKSFKK